MRLACARAGVNRSTAYRAREKDDKFAEQWDEALDDALDRLEEECIRRGRDRTDEPVYYKGEICGVIKRYSDTLLMFYLKAHRPEKYRERYEVKNTGIGKIEVVYVEKETGSDFEE